MFTHTKLIFAIILFGFMVGCSTAEPTVISEATIPTEIDLPSPTLLLPSATPTATKKPPTETAIPPTDIPAPATPWPQVIIPGPYDIHTLLILPKEVGPNWFFNEDNYESYGWNLTLAGMRESIPPCPGARNFYGLQNPLSDLLIPDIDELNEYHAIAIMPASKKNAYPYGDLLDSPEMLNLLHSADEKGLGINATCGGVRVLAAAGILEGKLVTGEPTYLDEYLAAGATYIGDNIPPVIDKNLITSRRGLYYNLENAEALAVVLENTMPMQADLSRDVFTIEYQIPERDTAWTKTYGGSSAEGARAISPTSDGGYIIVGYTFSFGAGYADIYVVKLDGGGNMEWSQTYGGPGWEYGNAIAETPDGGYIIAGYTTSLGAGGRDIYLVKTDKAGNQIWAQAYGGEGLDMAEFVAVTPEGEIIVAGYTEFFGVGENDIYLLKVDSQGDQIWANTFGGEAAEMGMTVIVNNAGDYVVAGATGSFDAHNRDFYLLSINSEGKQNWSHLYGYGEFLPYEWGNQVIQTSDGGYLLAGNSNVSTQLGAGELMNMYLVKTDPSGEEVWTRYIGRGQGYDYANAVRETKDGGFLVVGTTKSGSDNNDIYLVKVSTEGNVLWKKSFGDFGSEWATDLTITDDGEILIVGHTNSFGAGSFDFWLLNVAPDS